MSDPTGYKTRKTETSKKSSSNKKRALSAPIPDEYVPYKGGIVEPPIISYGKHNDTNIIVFGEFHNNIDNRFYENLILRDNFVFVEHLSTRCAISKEHTKLFFNILKGSDWVWYKYSARKKPIVCLDNRVELGLPTGIEQNYALQSSNADEVFPIILTASDILQKREIKIQFVRASLTPIYTSSITIIKNQLMDLAKRFAESEQEVEFDKNLMELKWKLVQNIIKLSAILVDINTINHIKEYSEKQKNASKKKDIFIFMGAAHAYRLHKFFPEIFPNIVYNTNDPELIESMQTITYE